MVSPELNSSVVAAHTDHRRSWRNYFYVYPVISRRSRGVSIGVNLNPDKVCNFDCVYCEVDRKTPARTEKVDLSLLEQELRGMIRSFQTGELFETEPFRSAPVEWRRLNDIAFSGDGEPTTFVPFAEVVQLVAQVKKEILDTSVKIVLITDAAGLDRASVKKGLEIMDQNQGEIWAKLDAGTEEYFKIVNRTAIRFERILKNIVETAQHRPICIQTLFLKIRGAPPSPQELRAYCKHLERFRGEGSQIKEVQIYTVARPTPEIWATELSKNELDEIGRFVCEHTGLPVELYYAPEISKK
jgi:wyosine [tRNA(Phe)-imidazoG37] synthetase (radical SAM superfamily)